MTGIQFRFYEELGDFLPPERRKLDFHYASKGRETVKHAIEACGVPHTEVEIILVDDNEPATSQMQEFAGRTHQLQVWPLASQYAPANLYGTSAGPFRFFISAQASVSIPASIPVSPANGSAGRMFCRNRIIPSRS